MRSRIALSHSRLSTYNQCPRKFKLQFIDKVFTQDDKSEHLVRGDNVHKALETYVIKKISGQTNIPPSSLQEVETTRPLIDKIFEKFSFVSPEIQIAVDENFKKVDWFDKRAYYRTIVDILAINDDRGFAGDYKTGKIRDYSGFGGQLHLTGAVILSLYPAMELVSSAYIYVDHKKVHRHDFTRDELDNMITHFHSEHEKVNADHEFKPKVNEFCKWCPANKSQCEYSRKL